LFTPIIKSFLTDLGVSATSSAQQVFGGHGYIREHGMEQLYRDCRITPIYEGTNEVQALDLVGRKLGGKIGQGADRLFQSWQHLLAANQDEDATREIAGAAQTALARLQEATLWLRERIGADDAAVRGAASNYQRLFALTAIACLWVDMVVTIREKSDAFYEAKRKTARFFAQQVLPETGALHEVITSGADALGDFSVDDFSN